MSRELDERAIAVIRGLAMDAPRRANSGHPGTAMALAPLAHVLFTRIMKHDPADPGWVDRDRFVLSAGHASMLLYSVLHLCGYDLSLDDLKAFRAWGSRTPGHPEVHHTPGVDATTGPLGQGIAMAVGMAIAERHLRARFGAEVVDHHTFVIAGDGDLQEGVSHEAASLAGHLGLERLVVVYDDNHITIDGETELSFSDDSGRRFEAYGWRVRHLGEVADDLDALESALRWARDQPDGRPTLLVLRSHIGHPSPTYTDTEFAHGNPFPAEEIARTKELLGLPPEQSFFVPAEVLAHYRALLAVGASHRAAWQERLAAWGGDRAEWEACWAGTGLEGWTAHLPAFPLGGQLATRQAIGKVINATLPVLPGVVGGGADLTGNTGTKFDGATRHAAATPEGRQLYFGVREHGMAAAMNGMALHGGVLPVGGTFFVFSDYMRPAVRLAALMGAKSVFVWTHDSVGLGEDGPTHQPVEQLMSLRAMPGLRLIRPADANETATAWRLAVEHDGPTGLVLTRQAVPTVTEPGAPVERGAYVLRDPADGSPPSIVLVGTGSEVHVCLEAADRVPGARVVSMPSWDLFRDQPDDYRASVFPAGVPRLSVEAGTTFGWWGFSDDAIGIDTFGASAPGAEVLRRFGITADRVVERATALIAARAHG